MSSVIPIKNAVVDAVDAVVDAVTVAIANITNANANANANAVANTDKNIIYGIDVLDKSKIKNSEIEPLLDMSKRRLTIEPLQYQDFWKMYKKQQASFWTAEEIDFSSDLDHFNTLNEDEQKFIELLLAFFAGSDAIVNINISKNFLDNISVYELIILYQWQMMMENIHSEVYSNMLTNIVRDPTKREFLLNSFQNVPSIKAIGDWTFKWINSDSTLHEYVIAMVIYEGVFFSGAFAAIFWLKRLKNKGQLFMPGLIKSNEFIQRDEGQHTETGELVNKYVVGRISTENCHIMFDEAVVIAQNFMKEALPCKLIGMNYDLMKDYIEYVSDRLLVAIDYPKKYNKKNPFTFMDTIGMAGKTNFHESRPTEYRLANINSNNTKNDIILSDDF